MRGSTSWAAVALAVLAAGAWSSVEAADEKPHYEQYKGVLQKEADNGKAKRKFWLTYEAIIQEVPAGTKKLEIWLPVPQKNKHQKIEDLTFEPIRPRIGVETKYGNKIAYWKLEGDAVKPLTVAMRFFCERKEIAADDIDSAKLLSDKEREALAPFMKASKYVWVGEKAQAVSDQAAGAAKDPAAISKAAYDYVYKNMSYGKPEGKAWGRGSTEWACTEKVGNCTDFHALFMSIARTKGIPVKFEMGIPLPPPDRELHGPIGGYHCWAKFYLGEVGWVPVDISEASKQKNLSTYYYGNLTADRVQLTTGRDLNLVPKQAGEALNFFVYPYVEADGKPIKADKAFSFEDEAWVRQQEKANTPEGEYPDGTFKWDPNPND